MTYETDDRVHPEALERELQLCARQEGRPTAALVREALAEYVARHRPAPGLPAFVAAFASGRTGHGRAARGSAVSNVDTARRNG